MIDQVKTRQFDTNQFTIDPSQRLRVADSHNLSDLKVIYQDDAYTFETVGTGTGTFLSNESAFKLAVTANQYLIRRSKQYFQYYPGNGQVVETTFDNFDTVAGVTKRLGYFSSNAVAPYDSNKDGFWLEDDGTTKYIVMENDGVEYLRVPITEWNESERFQAYNWQNFSIVQFDFLWLGGAVLRVFIKMNSEFVLAYQFDYPGTRQGPYMLYPSQNVRMEIRSTGGVGELHFHCARVATEGQPDDAGKSRSVNSGHTAVACAAIGTTYPILSVRKKSTRVHDIIQVDAVDAFVGSGNDQVLMTVQINPTLSAPLSYSDGGGAVEFAKGNGTITVTNPGRIQYSRHFASGLEFPANNLLLDFLNNIGVTIGNVSDEYVICATPITASVTLFASFTLREF